MDATRPAQRRASHHLESARYRASSWRHGAFQLITTLVPLGLVFTIMNVSLSYSYWLTLVAAPVGAGFLLRTFIIMHDCGHGSFVPSRRANDVIGFLTGLLTLTPYARWRRDHALHHASSGDLDRRGHGDVNTLTVEEYLARNWWGRFKYRAYRNPFVLLCLGPFYLPVSQRWRSSEGSTTASHSASVHLSNIAIAVIIVALSFAIGWRQLVLLYGPVFFIASAAGIWLFYVQHQFEGTYWEPHGRWNYETAALQGSSYYRLPRVLEWFTGGIGLHHVHHFDPRIPSYQLRRCHEEIEAFRAVPELTVRASLRAVSLKLWDAEKGCLVGFGTLRRAKRGPAAPVPSSRSA